MLCSCGLLYGVEYTWFGSAFGGDGSSWSDPANWSIDWADPAGAVPSSQDIVRIQALDWLNNYPTLQNGSSAQCAGLFMGLDNITHLTGASLVIEPGASLTTYPSPAHNYWNPGLQLGWYSDSVLTSYGSIDTQSGWVYMGNGAAGHGYGNATLIIKDGKLTTPGISFNPSSVNHIQLDGGVVITEAVNGLDEPGQSIDITHGRLVVAGDMVSQVQAWIASGGITAFGGSDTVYTGYDTFYPGSTMVTAEGSLSVCDEPVWWDSLLQIAETGDVLMAKGHNANVIFNHSATDPGWGVYGQKVTEAPWRKIQADAEGMKSVSYYETFGESVAFIAELHDPSQSAEYNTVSHTFWNWQAYTGGEVYWIGVHNWFDDEQTAQPWTRTHPQFGGPAMTYPDGSVAAGYDGPATDPRNSRVYDAACAKDIQGNIPFSYSYNDHDNANGQIYIAETGKYCGHVSFPKDSACPIWNDYTYASALYATQSGMHGMWTDNYSAWDSFSNEPVKKAFGDWSVARFRDYLSDNFSVSELQGMGIVDVTNFDVRTKLKNIAYGWGWNGSNLDHFAWDDRRWQDQPIWQAFMIFKRDAGTEALTNYDTAVHNAARENGIDDFFVMGNDIPLFSLGWARGNLDMVSTELTAGWNLSSGPRGFMLPPVGRLNCAYKLAKEHARSRFVNVWLYNEGYEDYLKHDPPQYYINTNLCWVVYSEMLAANTMPMVHPENPKNTGSIGLNSEFFDFVSQVDELFNRRDAVSDIGIYYSSSSVLNRMLPGGLIDFENQPHQFAVWGWATALGQLHHQYRLVPEWKLDGETLDGLRVLIVPESEVFDEEVVNEVLQPWVQGGGRLIVTGVSGKRDGERGNFTINGSGYSLSALTGVSDIASAPNTDLRSVGAGKVYYIKNNIGMEFFNTDTAAGRNMMLADFSNYLNSVLAGTGEPALASADPDVDENIGLTVYEDLCSGKLFVDIVNYNLVLETDQITPTGQLSFDIEMPAWLSGKELNAYVVSPDSTGPLSIDSTSIPGRIVIDISSVKYYACVVIEFQLDANIDESSLLVDLKDFSALGRYWMHRPCYAPNNWCDGTDIDLSNTTDMQDLLRVMQSWLEELP